MTQTVQKISAQDSLSAAKRVLTEEAEALINLSNTIGDDFMNAVHLIKNIKGRVIVSGMGKSGHIGNKIAATLASTGTPSFFVHPSEASHGDLGMITPDDVVIAIGHSGESKEMGDIIAYCSRFNIPLIAITGKATSTLGKAATIVLLNGVTKEACPVGKAPTTSSTASLALADALAIALMTERGFTASDFSVYHPGGKLGAQLLKVKDVMIAENLPLVSPETPTIDLLVEMADKNLGCVGVTDASGKLVGIFTDGDLKRHMNAAFLTHATKDVMHASPKIISANELATKGIQLMDQHHISALFVLNEQQQPIGLFRLHECLTKGVI